MKLIHDTDTTSWSNIALSNVKKHNIMSPFSLINPYDRRQ